MIKQLRGTFIVPFLLFPSSTYSDVTHHVDVYRSPAHVIYTNTADIIMRCQISTRVDDKLPIGQLAEIRNITLRPFLSYTHRRYPTEQIIYCEEEILVIDPKEAMDDNRQTD